MTNEDLQQIQNLVTSAHRVLILTHRDPGVDTMASALSLYLALTKMGKDTTIAMESQPLVEVSNLVGIDQVKTALDGKNLLVTYQPYTLGDFTKVSYLEDEGQGASADSFKLTITPREGYVPEQKNFNFSFTGGAADLIFTIEVLEPKEVGRLYDQGLFSATPIINIDNHDPNKDYGRFNLVEPDAASISEIVTFFLRAINAQLDADITGNLYQGIIAATGKFQSPKVAAATFEAAAICLRAGTKNKPASQQPAEGQTVAPQSQPGQPHNQPVNQPVNPNQNPNQNQNQLPTNGPVPEDWKQPKVYRGTSVS